MPSAIRTRASKAEVVPAAYEPINESAPVDRPGRGSCQGAKLVRAHVVNAQSCVGAVGADLWSWRYCSTSPLARARESRAEVRGARMSVPRSIVARMASTSDAPVREETYNGELHLVVPVIALLGNIVFWPTGAEGYEFVPDYVVSSAPVGWNGRPVIPAHPSLSEPTANTPAFLAANQYGQLFNTIYDPTPGNRETTGKLKTEAWLNTTRAAVVGKVAIDVIEKCRAGELVEVSVGAQIAFEQRRGSYGGYDYIGIWRGMVPDHLAMGVAEGACSVATGCGGPRTASIDTGPNKSKRSTVYLQTHRAATKKGVPTAMALTTVLTDRIRGLLDAVRVAASPAEAAEEAAELIAYESMQLPLDQAIASITSARNRVSQLIADESETPTETPDEELAEETVECARFRAIYSDVMAAVSSLYAVADTANQLYRAHQEKLTVEQDGATPVVIVGDTRYYADGSPGNRNAAGARNSKKDQETLQKVHDMSVKLGAECVNENVPKGAASGDPSTPQFPKPCGCGSAPANLFSKLV